MGNIPDKDEQISILMPNKSNFLEMTGMYVIKNSPLVAGDISNGSSFPASDGDETDLLVLEQDVQSNLADICVNVETADWDGKLEIVSTIKKQCTFPSIAWVLAQCSSDIQIANRN